MWLIRAPIYVVTTILAVAVIVVIWPFRPWLQAAARNHVEENP